MALAYISHLTLRYCKIALNRKVSLVLQAQFSPSPPPHFRFHRDRVVESGQDAFAEIKADSVECFSLRPV